MRLKRIQQTALCAGENLFTILQFHFISFSILHISHPRPSNAICSMFKYNFSGRERTWNSTQTEMNYVLLFHFSVFLFISQQTVEINSISSSPSPRPPANSIICLFLAVKHRAVRLNRARDAIKEGGRQIEWKNEEMLRVKNRFDDVLLLSIRSIWFNFTSTPDTYSFSLSSQSLNLRCECIVTLWNLSIDFHFVFPCMTLTFMGVLCIFGRLSERDRMEKSESSEGCMKCESSRGK